MYIEHLRIDTGLGALHVERVGRGRSAVLLLHGFGTNASLWRRVGARLAERGHLVIAPDLLGHGESDRPVDATYHLASHAEVLNALLAALRVPRAVVVGQDVGALVGLALAARFPDRVSQLSLVNPPDVSELPSAPVREMLRAASRLPLNGAGSRLGAAALLSVLLADAVVDPAQLPAASTARYLSSWVGPGGVEQLRRLAHTLEADSVPLDALREIPVDALIVRGGRDRSVPATVSQSLATALPHARLVTLPERGRLLAEDAPDTLVQTLCEWMRPATNEPVLT